MICWQNLTYKFHYVVIFVFRLSLYIRLEYTVVELSLDNK